MNLTFDDCREDSLLNLLQNHAGTLSANNGEQRFLELKKYLKPDLERAQKEPWQIILIAGTNGKGETAHTLNHLCLSEGVKVGLWTSPHILSLRERFSFQGEDLSYARLEQALKKEFAKQKEKQITLGFYESLFAIFLTLALEEKPKVLILEVGLGGRFDAVNLLTPTLSLITSISRDHEEFLGRGHRRILLEKLGITREHVSLFSNLELAFQREVCREYTEKGNIPWEDLFLQKKLTFKDHYSKRNKFLALKAFEKLSGKKADYQKIQFLSFKGRGERLATSQTQFCFIGAHNHDGMRKMVEGLKSGHLLNDFSCPFDTILLSFSKRPLSEIEACLRLLARDWFLAKHVVLTSFDHPKAMDGKTLSKFKGLVDFEADWKKILPKFRGKVLVTGSYYFVGEVQRFLSSHPC